MDPVVNDLHTRLNPQNTTYVVRKAITRSEEPH